MPAAVNVAFAALPLVVLLVLMLVLRWSAARAGVASLLVTLGVALAVFGYGDVVHGDIGRVRAVSGALAEAVWAALEILWILFPALGIYHLQKRTGALDVLQRSIRRVAGEPPILALLVAWFFALFLEGAAGFGTPIAIAAPFLVSAGFKPLQAVTLALLGHAAGVSFGAIGTPVLPQLAATDLSPLELSRATGIYAALLGWLLPMTMMALLWRDAEQAAWKTRAVWIWAAVAAGLFLAPYFVISRWVGPELPTLGGALAGGLGFAVLWYGSQKRQGPAPEHPPSVWRLMQAGAPYLVVVALILLTRLVAPIQDALAGVQWGWTLFENFQESTRILYHPGTILLTSLFLGAAAQRASLRVMGAALMSAARQLGPVSAALVAVLGLSRLMVHAGMIDVLAEGAARGAGPTWPLLTPLVGVLGTFVTGSATSSNILFTEFQQAAAQQAEIPALRALGAQGFGAAAGNMIAPLNLLAGAATVGLVGKESEILRRTLLICLVYAALGGALTWALT